MEILSFSTDKRSGPQLPDLGSLWTLIKELLWAYGLGFIWVMALGVSFRLSPLTAVAYGSLLVGLFVFFHVVRADLRARATARLRPLRLSWMLLAAGVGVAASFSLSTGLFQSLWLPSTPDSGPGGLEAILKQPGGFASVVYLIAVVFPLIEEFVFRGWIQRPIERLLGPWIAVPAAALLFAFTHSGVEWPFKQFTAGCFYGAAVWATRSIWIGVLLHMSANLTVSVFIGLNEFYPSSFAGMMQRLSNQKASVALVLVVASALAIWWVRRAARGSRFADSDS